MRPTNTIPEKTIEELSSKQLLDFNHR